ncbi:MAG: hypothetical protein IKC09_00320 [Oscillospiraceae bacterium]|nr:hypothetical protein [Oscillospiraceae bacterium]
MTDNWKKYAAGVLAVLLLAACLAGCGVQAADLDPTDPTEPSVDQTTAPADEPTKPSEGPTVVRPVGPSILGTAEMKQLRLPGYDSNWVVRFQDTFGACLTVQNADAFADAFASISGLGKNIAVPQGYGEEFFAENYLVLIPAASASGSVRYVADAYVAEEKISIVLEGRMPEIGTADMADWLLLVVLPRDQFPTELPVEIKAPDAPGIGVQENYNITDR